MKLRTAVLAAALLSVGGATVEPALAYQSRQDQASVVRAFRSVLQRDPSVTELRRYALLMDDYGWTETDVRRDLGERSDYRRYSRSSTWNVDSTIRQAYLDILGREPDARGLRSYRERIVREGWSEHDLRQALRESPEYRAPNGRTSSADRIVRRAYNDILRREPDPDGLATYRRAIIEDGWDEQDVRRALRRSDERREIRGDRRETRDARREIRGVSRNVDAEAMVRDAYIRVLQREPDAEGLRSYAERVRREGWTQQDVERALQQSPEYRQRFN